MADPHLPTSADGTPALDDAEVEPFEPTAADTDARSRRRIPLGMRYMAVGALFFSVMSLLVKIAGERIPSQQVVLVRAMVMLVISTWAVRRAGVSPWGTPSRRGLLLFRGGMGFVALSCFYYALTRIPLADATVVQYTNPVWAGLLAVPMLGERLRGRESLSVAASLAGVVIVTRPTFLFGGVETGLPTGVVALGLLGALCSGVAYVTVRKLGGTEHPAVIILWFSLVSVIGSIPLVRDPVMPTPREWLVLLAVGVTTQIGQWSITHGLRMERAGAATATAYLQIVFAAALGVVFAGEIPDVATVAGGALIIAATLALAGGRGRGDSDVRRAAA